MTALHTNLLCAEEANGIVSMLSIDLPTQPYVLKHVKTGSKIVDLCGYMFF